MQTFMLFQQQELIASTPIEANKNYSASNNPRHADIFIPAYNLNHELQIDFILQNDAIVFNQLNPELTTIEGQLVNLNQEYTLPIAFKFANSNLSLAINSEVDPAFNYFTLHQAHTQIEEELAAEPALDLGPEDTSFPESTLDSTPTQPQLNWQQQLWATLKPTSAMHYFIYIISGILILTATTIGIIYTVSSKPVVAKTTAATNPLRLIINKYPSLSINKISNGAYLVTGVVESAPDLIQIKQQLSHYPVKYNVLTPEEVQTIINQVQIPKAIKLHYQNHKIMLIGIVDTPDAVSTIYEAIADAIHMDIEIDTSQVFQQAAIESDFANLRANSSFSANLQINQDYLTNSVTLGGYLDSNGINLLNTLLEPLIRKYASVLSIKNQVIDRNSLDLIVQEVYLEGENSYIVINNQKVFVGGSWSEWQLMTITPKGISLKNLKSNYSLNLSLEQSGTNNSRGTTDPKNLTPTTKPLKSNEPTLEKTKPQLEQQSSEKLEEKDQKLKQFLNSQIDSLTTKLSTPENQEKELS